MKSQESEEVIREAAKDKDFQVVLLRVGIDTGSGGMYGPLFANGSFEFIPINDDRDRCGRKYENTKGRYGRYLSEYCCGRCPTSIKKRPFLHSDPEFETFTYGDPTAPKQGLKKLKRLLVLYAGLQPWTKRLGFHGNRHLYIVGYFIVELVGTYTDLKREKLLAPFAKNWHILNHDTEEKLIGKRRTQLVLIKGGSGSRLLRKAVKISADKKKKDRGGHPVFVLDSKMKCYFGNFTKLNAIQRSIPRWVKRGYSEKAAAYVLKLR